MSRLGFILLLESNLVLLLQVECDPGGEEEERRQDGPLTPDSGTFCPSDYGEGETSQSQSKIKKSTSLQFPRWAPHVKLCNCLMCLSVSLRSEINGNFFVFDILRNNMR